MMRRSAIVPLLLLVPLFFVGCNDSSSLTEPTPAPAGTAPPVRIEIVPGALLLPGVGETQQLSVRAYDAQGRPTAAEVSWRSSSPAVTVSAAGVAMAALPLGSAQITAEVGSVVSAPIVALVARPAAGTVLVSDAQVVGNPVQLDPAEAFGPGWRYRVTLQNTAALPPGTLLLASGGAVVAGRVLAVAPVGAAYAVTLELVPLSDLFEAFELHLELPLELADVDASGAPAAARALSPPGRSSGAPTLASAAGDEFEFPLGPFKCKVGSSQLPISLQNVSSSVTGSLTGKLDFSLTTGIETLAVYGTIGGQMTARPVVDVAWTGKAKCERDLLNFTVPIGAWLALFFGFQVPVGVGFSLEGGLELGQIGFDIAAAATAAVQMEYSCPLGGSCGWATALDSDATGSLRLISPGFDEAHLTLDGRGYVYAKLNLGPSKKLIEQAPFLSGLKFKLLEANAGLSQTVDLAGSIRQVADPGYASSFALRFTAELKADLELKAGFEYMEKKLGVVIQLVDEPLLKYEDTLARSPRGTFTITPSSVTAGDDTQLGELATFTIELDPVSYLGLSSVEAVEIRWRKSDGSGGFTLANGRPGCTAMAASSGQNTFSCQADFLEEHLGEQHFHAFVRAKLFGFAVPVPLEIAPDASAGVMVHMPGQLVVQMTFPDTVEALKPAPLRVRVGRLAPGGGAFEPEVSIQVSLDVSSGSVSPLNGVTDADGYLEAQVTAPANVQFITVQATASSGPGQIASGQIGAAVRQPPGEVGLRELMMNVCGERLDSVDGLPASLAGSFESEDGLTCVASASLSVTAQPDGVIVIESTAASSGTWHFAVGALWVLSFRITGSFHYEFDGTLDGSGGAGTAALWRGGGLFPSTNTAVACVSLGAGIHNFPCPESQVVTGILTPLANLAPYSIRAHVSGPGAGLSFRLTLTPVN